MVAPLPIAALHYGKMETGGWGFNVITYRGSPRLAWATRNSFFKKVHVGGSDIKRSSVIFLTPEMFSVSPPPHLHAEGLSQDKRDWHDGCLDLCRDLRILPLFDLWRLLFGGFEG